MNINNKKEGITSGSVANPFPLKRKRIGSRLTQKFWWGWNTGSSPKLKGSIE